MTKKIPIISFLLFCALGINAQSSNVESRENAWRGLSDLEVARGNTEVHKPNLSRGSKDRVRRRNGGQEFATIWHKGSVVLSDGSLLKGDVSYNIAKDVIQIKSQDNIQIFAANQIKQFEVEVGSPIIGRNSIDLKTGKKTYYSLPYKIKNGYSRPKLFEVLVEGNTSLLKRWVYGTRSSDRKLYLKNSEGKITLIKKRRGQVIKSFDDRHEELMTLAKSQGLDMYNTRDVIALVNAYNQLVEE